MYSPLWKSKSSGQMGNRQTHVRAQSHNGDSLQLTAHETDSPILPVVQLQQLHEFRPDLVDWVKSQTEKEADFRRNRQLRVDSFVLAERMGGLVAGAVIAGLGLGISAVVALNGQPWVAGILGGGTLVSIVTVLVTGRQPKRPSAQQTQEQRPAKADRSVKR
jgi:hypothetical protein